MPSVCTMASTLGRNPGEILHCPTFVCTALLQHCANNKDLALKLHSWDLGQYLPNFTGDTRDSCSNQTAYLISFATKGRPA